MKSFILAVLNHSAHTQLRHIQNRSISTHLDKKRVTSLLVHSKCSVQQPHECCTASQGSHSPPQQIDTAGRQDFRQPPSSPPSLFPSSFLEHLQTQQMMMIKSTMTKRTTAKDRPAQEADFQNLRIKRHVLKHLLYYISLRQAMKRKVIVFLVTPPSP